jgi:hypothetical protein
MRKVKMERFYLCEDMAELMRKAGLRIGSSSGIQRALIEERITPPTGRTVRRGIYVWNAKDARRAVNFQRRRMLMCKHKPLLALKRQRKDR